MNTFSLSLRKLAQLGAIELMLTFFLLFFGITTNVRFVSLRLLHVLEHIAGR